MPISRYPHNGLALAPRALAPILEVPNTVWLCADLSNRYPRLADLDESVWNHLADAECIACGKEVVNQVATERYSALFNEIRFPAVAAGTTPQSLVLERRTYNCVVRAISAGVVPEVAALQYLALNDFWRLMSGFGAKSIVDLLVALEHGAVEDDDRLFLAITADYDPLGSSTGPLTSEQISLLLADPTQIARRGVLDKHFPEVSSAVQLEDLQLGVRAYNCLKTLLTAGAINSISELRKLCIGDVLVTQNFGRKSLLELLRALATLVRPTTAAPEPTTVDIRVSLQLTRAAERLRDARGAANIRCNDPRLSAHLKPLVGFANVVTEEPPLPLSCSLYGVCHRIAGRTIEGDVVAMQTHIRRARSAMSTMRRATLETELRHIVSRLAPQRTCALVLEYHGWTGKGEVTLQNLGDRYQITRERVRQIISPTVKALRRSRPFTPVLDRILSSLSRKAPIVQSNAESFLKRRGMTANLFKLEGLLTAADIFGRPLPFAFERGTAIATLVRVDQIGFAKVLCRTARGAISRFGAAPVADICNEVSEKLNVGVPANVFAQVLTPQPGFRWLDDDNSWYWISELPRNHLRTRLLKVLSVAPRIHVSELRGAIANDPRGRYVPPKRVILEFCKQALACKVENDFVEVSEHLNPQAILSGGEMMQYTALSSCGPLATTRDFERECYRLGMNSSTFWLYAIRSPIVTRYARGIYGLRGANIWPGQLEQLALDGQSKERRSWEAGWTKNAQPWLLTELTSVVMHSGVFTVPQGMKTVLEGRFVLLLRDKNRIGTLVVTRNSCWGLGPLFTRSGGEPEDYLLLKFNLRSREVFAQLGTDRDSLIESVEDFESVRCSDATEEGTELGDQ
jgi:Bacterial RNA polymerase, alpha chain C terminal domain/Sigma-70, region 4